MSFKNNTIQKLISALIIISVLIPVVLFSKPKQANASGLPVVDIAGNILLGTTLGVISAGTGSTTVNTGLHIKDIVLLISLLFPNQPLYYLIYF